MYHLVEALTGRGDEVTVGGQVLPAVALVEDEHGQRALLSRHPLLTVDQAERARNAGVSYAIGVEPSLCWGTPDLTGQPGPTGHIDLGMNWHPVDHPPTYMDVVAHQKDSKPAADPFVNFHTHLETSTLDGLSTAEEAVEVVQSFGQTALAVTDHGSCAGHPYLQEACDEAGLKPIFGLEANLVNDRFRRGSTWFEDDQGRRLRDDAPEPARKRATRRSDAQEVLGGYHHLLLWARDDEGLRNLWAASTESHRDGFYGRARLDWDTLERHSTGLVVSTGCLRGPMSRLLLDGEEEKARIILGRLLEVFDGRVYVEIQTNAIPEQITLNKRLVSLAQSMQVPLLAAVDSHYPTPDHKEAHQAWVAAATGDSVGGDSEMFSGGHDYHLMSSEEVRERLSYLPDDVVNEAITNTAKEAERCTARIGGNPRPPVFTRYGENLDRTREQAKAEDERRLREMCEKAWSTTLPADRDEQVYRDRLEREMELLVTKGFCGYFLMVAEYVNWEREQGGLVGPGRGSGAASLVAWLCGITRVDPIANDFLFERFLTPGRKSLPDFDVDFQTTSRDRIMDHLFKRWGEDHVVRIGTHSRLKNKAAFKDAARVLRAIEDMPFSDQEKVSKLIDQAEAGTAGKGLPWDDLWELAGPSPDDSRPEYGLNFWRDKYPKVFSTADQMVGRMKTFSQHAAGVVVDPEESIQDRLPLRRSKQDGELISEFDMEVLENTGYVKNDVLTLRNLDTLALAAQQIGRNPDEFYYGMQPDSELADPLVWDRFHRGQTLGVFQFETTAMTRLTKDHQPNSVRDLSDISALVRPGPKRSGLTDMYLKRRHGEEEVTYPEPRLEPVLEDTYGIIVYQEQVIRMVKVLAGYSDDEADAVRKVVGKKQTDKVKAAGEKFIAAAVAHDTDRKVAERIWEQVAEFAKYAFNLPHSFCYSLVGYWCQWMMTHYPGAFLAACLSTVKEERIGEFVTEARGVGLKVLPPDVNESGQGFSLTTDGQSVRYGLDKVKGLGDAATSAILAARQDGPFTSVDDFLERKSTRVNSGAVSLLAEVGAFDSLLTEPWNRGALVARLGAGPIDSSWCAFFDSDTQGVNNLPCVYDWDSEPLELTKTGKLKKNQKPPPKKCTRSCRRFSPTEPLWWATTPDVDSVWVREVEARLLGVHLSSTVYDVIPEHWLAACRTARELREYEPVGQRELDTHRVACLVRSVRQNTDVKGGRYAFVSVEARDGTLDAICFASTWSSLRQIIEPGALLGARIEKTDRGYTLHAAKRLDQGLFE